MDVSILIVDDDIKLCATLSEDLNEIGYYSHFVTNAKDALEYIISSNVSLILLDLKMPEKDGFYLLSKISGLEKDLKIIVLTANVDVESALRAAKYGVDDYILKPYSFSKLLLTTRRVLAKQNSVNSESN